MTTSDELGKSDVFVKLVAMLFPLAEEAARPGMTMKKFEPGLLGGLLCTGNRVADQVLIAQENDGLGETAAHPDDGSDGEITEPRKIYRSSAVVARIMRLTFGEHQFLVCVFAEVKIAVVRSWEDRLVYDYIVPSEVRSPRIHEGFSAAVKDNKKV